MISTSHNIYNVNRMDKKPLYTALPRTTNYNYIHLNNNSLNNEYVTREQTKIHTSMVIIIMVRSTKSSSRTVTKSILEAEMVSSRLD